MATTGTILVPPPHPATLAIEDLLESCEIGRGRASGPGGQHRNKVETKITILHVPTGIEAHADERRSQGENRSVAIFRLRLLLATHCRAPVGLGEIRSALWLSRTRGGRIACNPAHADFPAMLAEALDVIAAAAWDAKAAALRLGCSMSQFVKLVKDHPHAFVLMNKEREARGLHPIK